jgi:hypothetical protein
LKGLFSIEVPAYNLIVNLHLDINIDETSGLEQLLHLPGLLKEG